MTDADIDRILRAADPAARHAAPDPGLLPVTAAAARPPRRRAGWVPVAAAAAVVAVVGAAVAVLPSLDDRGGNQAGGPPRPTAPATTTGAEKPQRDHTMSAGTEFERAHRLLGTLQAAVPAKYDLPAPAAMAPIGPSGERMPASGFQAVRDEGPYEGYTGFVYDADTTVTDGRRVGTVRVRTYEGVPLRAPCDAAKLAAWIEGGRCRVVPSAAGSVALVDAADRTDPRETQWAVFQRSDGTIVLVSQGPGVLNERTPGLSAPVWSTARLIQLATDPAFTR